MRDRRYLKVYSIINCDSLSTPKKHKKRMSFLDPPDFLFIQFKAHYD